jgi:hypothetical protein
MRASICRLLWLAPIALARPGLIAAAHAPGASAPAAAIEATTPTDDEARSLITAAREAANLGQWRRADASLRSAWRSPTMRRVAARGLWDLHQRPGFELRADEDALAATKRQLGPRYRRFETPHFVILTDADPAWSRARATILEQTRRQFYRAMEHLGYPAVPHERKLVCILIREHDQFRTFAAREDGHVADWSAGYYSTGANRVVFYNDDSSPSLRQALAKLDDYQSRVRQLRDQSTSLARAGRATEAHSRREAADDLERQVGAERDRLRVEAEEFSVAKTIHEAVHLLAFNSAVQSPSREYPLWLSEGLACAFEAQSTALAFGPDRPSPHRARQVVALYHEARLLPLERVIVAADSIAGAREDADVLYAQSFALIEFLYDQYPRQLAELILSFADDPAADFDPADHLARFRRIIGDPADISRRIDLRWAQ